MRIAPAIPLPPTSNVTTSGSIGAARADRGHAVAAAADPGPRPSPTGSARPVVSRSGSPPVQRDPPQLVGAVDWRREQHRRAVRGGDEPRALAERDVAVHRGVGLELARGEQVCPAARGRVRAVGREPPDAGPVAAARRSGRPARIAAPSGVHVGRPKTASPPSAIAVTVARGDVHDPDRAPLLEVRVPAPVRRERDPRPVRRPGGMPSGVGPATSGRASPVSTSTSQRCWSLSSMKPVPLYW